MLSREIASQRGLNLQEEKENKWAAAVQKASEKKRKKKKRETHQPHGKEQGRKN